MSFILYDIIVISFGRPPRNHFVDSMLSISIYSQWHEIAKRMWKSKFISSKCWKSCAAHRSTNKQTGYKLPNTHSFSLSVFRTHTYTTAISLSHIIVYFRLRIQIKRKNDCFSILAPSQIFVHSIFHCFFLFVVADFCLALIHCGIFSLNFHQRKTQIVTQEREKKSDSFLRMINFVWLKWLIYIYVCVFYYYFININMHRSRFICVVFFCYLLLLKIRAKIHKDTLHILVYRET